MIVLTDKAEFQFEINLPNIHRARTHSLNWSSYTAVYVCKHTIAQSQAISHISLNINSISIFMPFLTQ